MTDDVVSSRKTKTSYQVALSQQPTLPLLANAEFKLLAMASFAVGGVLVLSSMWALGVTGTYLGDYFVSAPARSESPRNDVDLMPFSPPTGHPDGRKHDKEIILQWLQKLI